jgi:phenylpropionate dioxygenase-like ring-hydroxylating dioxygenase large terminal subunit
VNAPTSNRALNRVGAGYVRQAWYAAAWSDELKAGVPYGCTMLGDPVVVFRDSAGKPVALEDRCIHRSVPLSLGRVRGNVIECGYHGMQFDCRGRCVRIPGQSSVPAAAAVRNYPAVEQDGFIWLWMGDARDADPSAITPFPWISKPGWQQTKLHARIECHYQLIIDNLLDLSHLAFVHASTVGSMELADVAKVKTETMPQGVRVSRWTLDVAAARTYAQFGKYDGNIDRWQISEFRAPCTFIIRNGSAKAGTGAAEGRGGEQPWEFIVCHGITPESDRVTNYFWAVTHDFGADNPGETAEFHRQSHQVINEDIAVFVAQQRMLERFPDAPIMNIAYDAGPIQARRLIDRLLAGEHPLQSRAGSEFHVPA